jgi:molybdopterin converting factor small subunit
MEVLLFGMLAEKAGTTRLQVDATSIAELRRCVAEYIPDLHRLDHVIAVDRIVVLEDRPLAGNEEVAFLPPFAGG